MTNFVKRFSVFITIVLFLVCISIFITSFHNNDLLVLAQKNTVDDSPSSTIEPINSPDGLDTSGSAPVRKPISGSSGDDEFTPTVTDEYENTAVGPTVTPIASPNVSITAVGPTELNVQTESELSGGVLGGFTQIINSFFSMFKTIFSMLLSLLGASGSSPTDIAPTLLPTLSGLEETPLIPSEEPSVVPSEEPSIVPPEVPSEVPSEVPTIVPSEEPSIVPTEEPSAIPSEVPSIVPSEEPSVVPSVAPSEPILPSNGHTKMEYGGQNVEIWAITKESGGDGATVVLTTVNDTDIDGFQKLALANGFEVVEVKGNSDAGALLLRPTGAKQNYDVLLDYGKVTLTCIKEPAGLRLTPTGGGFESVVSGGMGFGTTDNVDTKGEMFLNDAGNKTIIANGEDDGRLWNNAGDIKNFRGGWMSLQWS